MVDNSPALMYWLKIRIHLLSLLTMNPLKRPSYRRLSAELSKAKSTIGPKLHKLFSYQTAERSGNAAAKLVDDMSFDEYSMGV